MKTYLIILKLSYAEVNYPVLVNYLKTASGWARPAPFAWIIKASVDSAEIRDGIKKRINFNDGVLVIEVPSKNWATSNISKSITDWMKNNI